MRQKRIAAVLRVRRLQEQQARGALALGNAALGRARAAEEEASQQIRACGERVFSHRRAPELVRDHQLVSAGMGALDGRRAVVEQRRSDVAHLGAEWTAAARRVDALERLEGRLADLAATELERVERLELDDLAAQRHRRQHEASQIPGSLAATFEET